jgi:hypothetical protein
MAAGAAMTQAAAVAIPPPVVVAASPEEIPVAALGRSAKGPESAGHYTCQRSSAPAMNSASCSLVTRRNFPRSASACEPWTYLVRLYRKHGSPRDSNSPPPI